MPSNNNYDPDAVADYIVQSAQARGIDPSVALSVAGSEGLHSYVGDQGTSFGPFQLHYGNMVKGANSVGGLGDEFTKATGKHASDPSTIRDQIDFALDNAAKNGWAAFHGAANSGIGQFDGISNKSKALGNYSSSGNQSAQDDPDGEALLQSLIKQATPQQKPVSASEGKVFIKEATTSNPQFPDEAPPLTVKRSQSPQFVQEQDPEGEALLKSLIGSPTQAPVNPDIAPQIKAPISANNVVRSVGTGIPIVGGLLNKADAATNALLAPVLNPLFDKKDQLQGDTWQDRYQNALNIQNGMDQSYAEQHPIANTAGEIAGGVLGTIPAANVAPLAFGIGDFGLLPRSLLAGATGAAIGGADSAVRNGLDPGKIEQDALVNGAFGLLGPGAGDVIGAGVNKLSNVFNRTTPAARVAVDAMGDMTPSQMRNELSRLGPDAMAVDTTPSLINEGQGIVKGGGQPMNIMAKAMREREKGADDQMVKIVNDALGPKPDAQKILNDIRSREEDMQFDKKTARAALDSSIGEAVDPYTQFKNMTAKWSSDAQPLYEKSMKGGSIAPLEDQFNKAFGEASNVSSQAAKDLASAQQNQLLARAKVANAGNNVYAANSALSENRLADAQVNAAQKAFEAAEQNKQFILAKLRQAQKDGSAHAPGAIWSPRIQQFLDDPIMQSALGKGVKIQRLEALASGKPFNPTEHAITGMDETGNPIVSSVPNMRTLNIAKKGLDTMVEESKDPVTGKLSEEGRAIDQVRRAFVSHLDEINPDYKAARQAWAGPAAANEAFNRGLNLFRNQSGPNGLNSTPAALKSWFDKASDSEKEAAKLGVRAAFEQQMQNAGDPAAKATMLAGKEVNQQKLASILGNDEAQKLIKQLSFRYEDPVGQAFGKGLDVFRNRQGLEGIGDTADSLKSWIKSATPGEIEAVKQGARQAIEQAITSARGGDISALQSLFGKSTANRDKLNLIFPDAQKMLDGLEANLQKRAATNVILHGAKTAQTIAAGEKYKTPSSAPLGGDAAMVAGALAGGGVGAAAGKIGGMALQKTRDAMALAKTNNLRLEMARGLTALPGTPEQTAFLQQIERAYPINGVTNALSNAGSAITNIIGRNAAPYGYNALFPQQSYQ